jgi:hypothetical protein
MRVAIGKVIGRKVVIDGAPFEEGANVMVITPDDTERSNFRRKPVDA